MSTHTPIHCPFCARERGVAIPKFCPHVEIGDIKGKGDTMTYDERVRAYEAEGKAEGRG